MKLRLLFLLVALSLAAAACGGEGFVVIDAPDDKQTVELGEDGTYGVGWVERTLRVRGDRTVQTDIFLPLETVDRTAEGPFPVVVGIQGGLVDQDGYRWLYRHIASRGYVVLAPHHPTKLAIFQSGNGAEVLQAARTLAERTSGPVAGMLDDERAMAIGHSLGGVVAAKNWLYAPQHFSHLGLLASYPAPWENYDREASRDEDEVLSIIGSEDDRTEDPPRKSKEGLDRIEEPGTYAVIDGMNHYQWGALPSTGNLRNDGTQLIDTDVARQRALVMFDAFLERFSGGEGALLDDPAMWPDGVSTWSEYKGAN